MRKQTYAFSHDWNLVIPGGALMKVEAYSSDTELTANPFRTSNEILKDNMNLRCKSSTIPKSTVRTEKVKVYGMSTNVILEDDTEGSITLVFLEDANHGLYRLFSTWKDLGASHRTYAIGDRSNYSIQEGVQLQLLTSAYNKTGEIKEDYVKLTFNLYGVAPIKVELSELSNEVNFMTLTVTLKYDCFEVI